MDSVIQKFNAYTSSMKGVLDEAETKEELALFFSEMRSNVEEMYEFYDTYII